MSGGDFPGPEPAHASVKLEGFPPGCDFKVRVETNPYRWAAEWAPTRGVHRERIAIRWLQRGGGFPIIAVQF
jgi:hypothetical protein